MRVAVLGCVALVVLVAVVSLMLPNGRTAFGQQPSSPQATSSDGGLTVLSEIVEQRYQQLIVIDPKREVISVYHIELASGTIALRSVRNIHWDLQMSDYNGQKPLAQEIQALSEQR
ncbi:MAG: hypothetical protein JW888_10005 [Pirellulales bacterium]|nr:hypothetical protein [Pirellulales bacterium]